MAQLTLRPLSELLGPCPRYEGTGTSHHRWITDVFPEANSRGGISLYVEHGYEGWDASYPVADPVGVSCYFCGALVTE